jgi:hypothetical protein
MTNEATEYLSEGDLAKELYEMYVKVVEAEVIDKQESDDHKAVTRSAVARSGLALFFSYAVDLGLFVDPMSQLAAKITSAAWSEMLEEAIKPHLRKIVNRNAELN